MTRDRIRRSQIIEKSILNAMSSLDSALAQMVALDTDKDNKNYTTINQCKRKMLEVLQLDYDALAIKRKTK